MEISILVKSVSFSMQQEQDDANQLLKLYTLQMRTYQTYVLFYYYYYTHWFKKMSIPFGQNWPGLHYATLKTPLL